MCNCLHKYKTAFLKSPHVPNQAWFGPCSKSGLIWDTGQKSQIVVFILLAQKYKKVLCFWHFWLVVQIRPDLDHGGLSRMAVFIFLATVTHFLYIFYIFLYFFIFFIFFVGFLRTSLILDDSYAIWTGFAQKYKKCCVFNTFGS